MSSGMSREFVPKLQQLAMDLRQDKEVVGWTGTGVWFCLLGRAYEGLNFPGYGAYYTGGGKNVVQRR